MAKAEKRDSETQTSRLNQLTLRCGDCLHYKGSPHPQYGAPCSTLGIKPYGEAPSCYAPNVMLFRKAGADTFTLLATILAQFSPQQSRILMGLLKGAGSLEKYGYTFLEKVYFRMGDDYLDNYFTGRVLSVGLNGTLAVVGENYFHKAKNPLVAYLFPESLMSLDKFKKRRAKLEKSGMIYVPKRPHRNKIEGEYEPPTMETSPELLEKMANKTFGKKVKPKIIHESASSLEINLDGVRQESRVTDIVKGPIKRGRREDDPVVREEEDEEEFEG